MTRAGKRIVICAAVFTALVGAGAAAYGMAGDAARRLSLKSNDLTRLRREALTMFPRGSRLQDVTARLVDIGFACEPMRRGLADVSAPGLLCASNGRGYPDYPAINVTVSTRNGLVSEIEIWNIIARSDDDQDLAGPTGDGSVRLVLSTETKPSS